MTFEDFYNQYNGKPVEAEDASALDQCMDLAFVWCDTLGIPRDTIRHPVAYQVFTNPNASTTQHFDLIVNTPDGVPQKGDLVIFSTVVGPAGHICIANGNGNADTFESFDQNWNGHSYAEIVTHTYNGVLGWLHPKSQQQMATITQAEVDQMRTDRDKNWNLYQAAMKDIKIADQKIGDLQAEVNRLTTELAQKPPESPVPSVPTPTAPPATDEVTIMNLKAQMAALTDSTNRKLAVLATIKGVAYGPWLSWVFSQQQIKDSLDGSRV